MTSLRERVVALGEGAHGPPDLVLHEPPHGEERLLEASQLVVEVTLHALVS